MYVCLCVCVCVCVCINRFLHDENGNENRRRDSRHRCDIRQCHGEDPFQLSFYSLIEMIESRTGVGGRGRWFECVCQVFVCVCVC